MKPRVCANLAAALLAAFLTAVGGVNAQSLQRLHVQTLTLSSDISAPELETPFHLTIHARVSEPIVELRNLELPVFSGLESLGDQRTLSATRNGSNYDEVLTVVAHQTGTIDVTPAYLDAIDARDGKPKRFISNSLRLTVGRGALSPVNAIAAFFMVLFRLLLGAILLVAAAFVMIAIFRRRTVPVVTHTVMPLEVAPESADPSTQVSEALNDLRSRRDRVHVLRLREALWRRSNVSPGATLADFLIAEPNVRRRSAARSVEVAAFVEDRALQQSIDEAIRATEGAL
ncbi:MAG: hypothetical protein JO165_03635 [Candidatus Eremiobacteraeota bacterium]|nr:hypothetical protein [Candidatus Eremiobacteraeota bacterium]